MSKKTAKILSLLLAVLMTAAVFAGCSGEKPEATTAEGTTAETTAAPETTEGPKDLGGYRFVIGKPGIIAEYLNPDHARNYGKRTAGELKDIYQDIEDTYNCEIVFEDVYNDAEKISASVLSGDKHCDIICIRQSVWIPLALRGHIFALDSEEILEAGLDINDNDCFYQYYTHLSDLVVDGEKHTYAADVSGKYSRFPFGHTYAFNKNKLEAAGYPAQTLFNLVYNKQWTYEKFIEVATAATQKDNEGKFEVYGVSLHCSNYEVWTNGTHPIVFNQQTNKWEANTDNAKLEKAFDFIKEICYNDRLTENPFLDGAAGNSARREWFYQGKAAFAGLFGPQYGDDNKQGTLFMDANNRPGLLPMPMGPDADEYTMIITDCDLLVMPGGHKNWDKTAYIFARIADAVHDDEEYVEYLKYEQMLGCEGSFKVLTEYLLPNLTLYLRLFNSEVNEYYAAILKDGKSFAEAGQEYKQIFQQKLNEAFRYQ